MQGSGYLAIVLTTAIILRRGRLRCGREREVSEECVGRKAKCESGVGNYLQLDAKHIARIKDLASRPSAWVP